MITKALRGSLGGLLLLAGSAGHAEELDLTLRASGGYTDNVDRVPSDERSSGLFAPGLDITYAETTRHLDADIRGDLDYVSYTAQGISSQFLGNFYGAVAYSPVPEKFVWNFNESYGQGTADRLQPSSPQNTQGINYFSTGPEVTLQFSNRMFVQANARYANSWYQDQDTDNNQYGGGVSLGRDLSQATRIAASVDYLKVSYSNPDAAPDSDIWEYYLAYSANGARSKATLNAGYRSLDDGSGSKGGLLVRLNFTRQLSAYTSVFLLAGDEFSQAASQMNGTLGTPGSSFGNNGYSNGDLFTDKYGGGGFNFDRMRTRFSAMVTYHDQNYVQDNVNDLRRWNFNGSAERDLTRTLTAGLQAWYYHQDYTNTNYSNSELDYGLYANWKFARTIGLTVEWDRWQSTASDQPNAHENQYWLRLNWHAIHRPGRTGSGVPPMDQMPAPPPGT